MYIYIIIINITVNFLSIFFYYETPSNQMNNYAKLLQCLQSNGLVERFNQTLQNMLRKYSTYKKRRRNGMIIWTLAKPFFLET